MANLQYVTKEGERWDYISFKAFGNSGLSKLIIAANPNVPITDVLPAGVVLDIPIQEEETVLTNQELTPPWF